MFDGKALDEFIRQRKENERRNDELFADLEEALSIAELKHPVFATSFQEALLRVLEEAGECAQASNKRQGQEREDAEVMDLLCVVWRLARGDWRG
jgi:NTP pyrophosphatase (non-canonical NTP hydrolase)